MALLTHLGPRPGDGLVWSREGSGRWVACDRSRRFVAMIEAIDGRYVPMLADGRELRPRATPQAACVAIVDCLTPDRAMDLVMHVAGAAGAIAVAVGLIQAVVTAG